MEIIKLNFNEIVYFLDDELKQKKIYKIFMKNKNIIEIKIIF